MRVLAYRTDAKLFPAVEPDAAIAPEDEATDAPWADAA